MLSAQKLGVISTSMGVVFTPQYVCSVVVFSYTLSLVLVQSINRLGYLLIARQLATAFSKPLTSRVTSTRVTRQTGLAQLLDWVTVIC